jgi:hypothetical protein
MNQNNYERIDQQIEELKNYLNRSRSYSRVPYTTTSLEEHEKEIVRYMEQDGEYTHNLISLRLRRIDKDLGRDVAHAVIRKYRLDELYGIRPIAGYEKMMEVRGK